MLARSKMGPDDHQLRCVSGIPGIVGLLGRSASVRIRIVCQVLGVGESCSLLRYSFLIVIPWMMVEVLRKRGWRRYIAWSLPAFVTMRSAIASATL